MSNGMIYIITLLIKHHVSEIVVLIDNEIERIAVTLGFHFNHTQFIGSRGRSIEFFDRTLWISILISRHKSIQLTTTIKVKVSFQILYPGARFREIKEKYLIAPLQRCRIPPNLKVPKTFFKFRFL